MRVLIGLIILVLSTCHLSVFAQHRLLCNIPESGEAYSAKSKLKPWFEVTAKKLRDTADMPRLYQAPGGTSILCSCVLAANRHLINPHIIRSSSTPEANALALSVIKTCERLDLPPNSLPADRGLIVEFFGGNDTPLIRLHHWMGHDD